MPNGQYSQLVNLIKKLREKMVPKNFIPQWETGLNS